METTERHPWLIRLQTWLIVTVIAVLVWLYAEGEAVTEKTEQLQIKFVPPPGVQLAIEPVTRSLSNSDATLPVFATFRASTGQMDQVRQITNEGPIEIVVNAQPDSQSPEQVIIFRDKLQDTKLGLLGINIVDTNPATATVRVEPLRTEMLDVTVDVGDVQLAGLPTIEPAKVPVTMPVRIADAMRGVRVVAQLDELDLSQYLANEEHTVNAVPLELPDELQRKWVELGRDSVKVTFTIRKQTDTWTISYLPVEIQASPLLLRRFSLDIRDEDLNLLEVKLQGPADVVDRIRKKELPVSAAIYPSIDELETALGQGSSATLSVPVKLTLPQGVIVQSPMSHVQVKVTRRE